MANNREIIAHEIVKRFTDAISGNDDDLILEDSPEDRIFVGRLSPRSKSDEIKSSILIKQISLNFRIPLETLDKVVLSIIPKGFYFYRIIPSLKQQQFFYYKKWSETFSDNQNKDFASLLEAYNNHELSEEKEAFRVPLLPVYKKVRIEDYCKELLLPISTIFDTTVGYGSSSANSAFCDAISESINLLNRTVSQSEDLIPCQFRDHVCLKDIISKDSWDEYIKKQASREDVSMLPKFDYSVSVDCKRIGEIIDISVALSNETCWGDETRDKYRIDTLFNSGIKVSCIESVFVPIELDYFENDYKYDRNVYAVGSNCNVEYDLKNMSLETVHVPVYIQNRLVTNDELPVTFSDMIGQPVQTLTKVYQYMLKELTKWNDDFHSKNELTLIGKRQFQNEINAFEMEIKRFKTGIDLIEKYNMVKDAFVYMNEAFMRAAKGYNSWRLFQIVFIVSLILDIVAHEPDLMLEDDLKNKAKTDDVDVLFFPTGGGKTEAFLGILVFNLFFDRIRGKECGVTAFIKYPLRLLSVQQVQRVSNILAIADLIRKDKGLSGKKFSLGYFVGKDNTPNQIGDDLKKDVQESSPEELNNRYRLLDVCPYCGNSSIDVVYNAQANSLEHICRIPGCPSGGTLPLYMTDDDIYRRIPSVIISTVDKMTAVGLNSRFHNLIYGAENECPDHGFFARRKCLDYHCQRDSFDMKRVVIKDPAPTLLIQDELHLIKESLGVYDAHYETLIEYFIKHLSGCNRGIKVIGATATISAYETQAKHLYWKNAIRFPSASPYLDHNCYSHIDYNNIGRIIIGYAPFGKAIVNSVAYSVQYLKKVIYELYQNPQILFSNKELALPDDDEQKANEIKRILQDYWIILEYNNVKQEGNRVIQALEDPINTELISAHVQPLIPQKMTGDDSFQEVRGTLSSIEHAKDVVNDLSFNMIVATSMISHGVDADRFNVMFFYGMPGNTAEYIQAYSRVGRKHPGIVIDIMRPSREKDQSYLKHFYKFHDYKDILVDTVSINRWASKAVDNTLPGVVSSLFLNHYLYKLQFTKGAEDISKYGGLKTAIHNKLISLDEVKQHVFSVYKCSEDDSSVGKLYRARIEEKLSYLFDGLTSCSCERSTYLTHVFNYLHFHIMESLRDTDKQVLVELK